VAVVIHAYNPSTGKDEAGVQGQPRLQSKSLSQNLKKMGDPRMTRLLCSCG
jgi:hypothetical protein